MTETIRFALRSLRRYKRGSFQMRTEVKPLDPATLIVVIIGILVVGFCAVFFPALRAIRTDPMDVLRNS